MRDRSAPRAERGSSAPETAWLATLVYETLDKVASPAARNALIKAALTAADRERMPDDPEGLLNFAVGPLRDAVTSVLGSAAGDALVQDLEPILQHAAAAAATEPEPEPAFEAELDAELELAAEPEPEPEPAFEAELDAELELAAEPEPEPEPEPEAEPVPVFEAELELESGFELATEPATVPAPPEPAEADPVETAPSPSKPPKRQTLPGVARVRMVEDASGARIELIGADGQSGARVSEARRHSTFPYVAAVLQQADARHVVVIDDERAFLAGYNGALRQRGFEVFTAPHREAAVALCRRLQPECVIASAAMPELEATGLAAAIGRAGSSRAPLAVIISKDPGPPTIVADELWLVPRDRSPSECVAEVAELLGRRRDEA